MSPHRVAARIDAIYRGVGVGLAVEMVARGVLSLLASIRWDTVYQVTAGWSFPFTLIGGALILACHLNRAEQMRRYVLGALGHLFGLVWAFMFGGAILVSWLLGTVPTAIVAPMFLLAAVVHGMYLYANVKGAKWTRKP